MAPNVSQLSLWGVTDGCLVACWAMNPVPVHKQLHRLGGTDATAGSKQFHLALTLRKLLEAVCTAPGALPGNLSGVPASARGRMSSPQPVGFGASCLHRVVLETGVDALRRQ